MNFSLGNFVKYLAGDKSKYQTEKRYDKQLELLKQKRIYFHEYMSSFENFDQTKLRDRENLKT